MFMFSEQQNLRWFPHAFSFHPTQVKLAFCFCHISKKVWNTCFAIWSIFKTEDIHNYKNCTRDLGFKGAKIC